MSHDVERKRAYDREQARRRRAAMTPEERAEARREADARYREAHREERRAAERTRKRKRYRSKRDTATGENQ